MTGADTSVSALEGVSASFIALCTLTVGLRFLARRRQGIGYGADDWCMLATLPLAIAYCGCVIGLVRIGWEGHGAEPFPESEFVAKFQQAAKIVIASDVALFNALALTKASALLLYRRIFCTADARYNRGLRYAIYGTLVILPLWVITFCFLAGFQCGVHLLESYKTEINARYCHIGTVFSYGLFISDLILDVWVICLPIPSIFRLHTTLSRKLLTIALFLVALVGIIASALRLANFLGGFILHTLHFPKGETQDLSSTIFFYNTLELGMFIISVNLAVLWGLLTRFVPEHMVKMARSVVSLVSSASGSPSNTERSRNPSRDDGRRGSAVKMSTIYSGKTGSSEAHVTHDACAPPVPELPKSSILVNETVQVSRSEDASTRV